MNHPQIEVKYKKTRRISKEMLADLYSSKEKLEDFIEEMEILSDPELNDYKIVLSKKARGVYKKADQQFKALLCKAVEKVLEHPNCGKTLKYELVEAKI